MDRNDDLITADLARIIGDFVLTDVVHPDGHRGDLSVTGGVIAAAPAPGSSRHDASNHVVLPRLVESHVHLDKSFVGGPWVPHRPTATLLERIDAEIELLDPVPGDARVAPVVDRAERLIELLVANGSTRIRSHVDIGPGPGLRRLEGVLAARDRTADIAEVSLVAFPQQGVMRAPGTAELLREALSMGVEAIGGLDPSTLDGARDAQLDLVFELATEFGVRIDIHLHERGPVDAATLRAIAARTSAAAWSGRVAVSHAYCLADLQRAELLALAAQLADAGVTLVSAVPGGGIAIPFDDLFDVGLPVVFGSDNIRDSWSPFGSGDVLERIALAAHQLDWYRDEQHLRALDAVTSTAATMLGEHPPLLRVGERADFTLIPDTSLGGAVLGRPGGRIVVRAGRTVAADGHVVRHR